VVNAIAAGYYHSLGIRADGMLAARGDNYAGDIDVPAGTFVAIGAGASYGVALRARTAYDDVVVNYSGSAVGPNGLEANLNRSITVAGNANVESPMFLYNMPTMTVVGQVRLKSGGQINGAETINGRITGETGSAIVATGALSLGASSHVQGFFTNGDLGLGGHTVTLQSGGFASLGGATSLGGGTNASKRCARMPLFAVGREDTGQRQQYEANEEDDRRRRSCGSSSPGPWPTKEREIQCIINPGSRQKRPSREALTACSAFAAPG
jgi:hypothetical protein